MWHLKKSTCRSAVYVDTCGFSLSRHLISALAILVLSSCVLFTSAGGQLNQPACGKRKVQDVFLISYGVVAKPGHWPWHAAIYLDNQIQLEYSCGGTIIGINTVLTAAHCLILPTRPVKENEISVHVGRVALNENSVGLQVFVVSKIIIHPDFIARGVEHDIGIVRLGTDIVTTDYVQPVCLWSMRDDNQTQIVGKTGNIAGFGATEPGKQSGFLLEAELTVVDHFNCILNDRTTYGKLLTHNMYCAYGTQKASACKGDSGGGMFFQIGGTWYVRGIISFMAMQSNGVCDSSKYTVFTDVSKYYTWILQYINTPKRLTHLEPCKNRVIQKETMCNIANRFDSDFLLVALSTSVVRVPLEGGQSYQLTDDTAAALDRDCAEGRFYWSDFTTRQIRSGRYDGTDQKPFVTRDIISPEGLAVDWISRRLYWTDVAKKTIEVVSLDNPGLRTVLISEDLVQPRRVAVDPLENKLYWVDSNRGKPKIEWSNLDGTERQQLIGSPQLALPYSIQVSMTNGELCYADSKKIVCIDPTSKKTRTIANNLNEPNGLAVTDELFYWTDFRAKKIDSINKYGVLQKSINSSLFENNHFFGMTAVSDKCPIFYSPCAINNGGCPQNKICLISSRDTTGRSCK